MSVTQPLGVADSLFQRLEEVKKVEKENVDQFLRLIHFLPALFAEAAVYEKRFETVVEYEGGNYRVVLHHDATSLGVLKHYAVHGVGSTFFYHPNRTDGAYDCRAGARFLGPDGFSRAFAFMRIKREE